jgi:hypothetical protein
MTTLLLALLLSARPHLTLDQVVAPAAVTGTSPTSPAWSPDGQRLAFLWDDRGGARSVWLVGRDGDGLRRLTGEAGTAPPRAVSGLAWTPDDAALVTLEAGDVWLTPAAGGEPRRLTTGGGDKATLAVSPDGRLASWLQDGDLWTVPLSGGEPRRLTSVGVPGIAPSARGTYARPDVEIGPGVWTGPDLPYRWSPDSRRVAVHVVDRRQVRRVGFPAYLGGEATMEVVHRAAPGDRNEERRVGLVDAARTSTWPSARAPLTPGPAVPTPASCWGSWWGTSSAIWGREPGRRHPSRSGEGCPQGWRARNEGVAEGGVEGERGRLCVRARGPARVGGGASLASLRWAAATRAGHSAPRARVHA